MEARRPRGMHTYCEYATLSHLPSVLIIPVQSSMPLDAAVLAAPKQRVWLQYFSLSRPTPSPSQQNGVLLTLSDFWSWNNGPGVPSQLNAYSLPLWPPDIDPRQFNQHKESHHSKKGRSLTHLKHHGIP